MDAASREYAANRALDTGAWEGWSTAERMRFMHESAEGYMELTAGRFDVVAALSGRRAGFGSISIRGVSTGDQTIATVGTYIDDVAYGSSTPFALGSVTSLDMALLDLHHIELLRGPQGTLYGAGAMGGLLKYVTNEPNPREFSGKAAVGFSATRGGRPGHTENIVLNVPLRENVAALRVAAFNDRIWLSSWVNTFSSQGARLRAWKLAGVVKIVMRFRPGSA